MMFRKGYVFYTLTIIVCLAISIEARQTRITRTRFAIRFNVDNVPINYHMTIFTYEYDSGDIEVNQDENSATVGINIKKAKIRFGEGLSKNEQYTQFDIPQGAEFELKTQGTAQISENRVRNCQFTFTENKNAPITRVPDIIKQGIFNKLPSIIGRDLCKSIHV